MIRRGIRARNRGAMFNTWSVLVATALKLCSPRLDEPPDAEDEVVGTPLGNSFGNSLGNSLFFMSDLLLLMSPTAGG